MADEGFTLRLSQVVEEAGGQNALARKSGLSQSGIARLVGGGEPTLSTLKAIASASGRSLLWLATGANAKSPESNSDAPGIVMIPILDVFASAGAGAQNDRETTVKRLPFPERFLRRLGVSRNNVAAIRARGDSMEPTIADGSLVLINGAAQNLVDGRIYALRAADGLRIKRIQRSMDGAVILISDNSDRYPPERLTSAEAETVLVAGHVFWTERIL